MAIWPASTPPRRPPALPATCAMRCMRISSITPSPTYIATGEFAAAVSNAGGLGLIAAGSMNAETLREQIHKCRELTDKPFGVNIMLMNPDVDAIAQMVIDENIKVVTTGAGNPGKYMVAWKEAGLKVLPGAATVALAKRLERSGADAIIVEGTEAGGHIGELTTFSLVPQVVDAVSVPVVAAGGIATGRQVLAAFALGASGVQVGTCLLVSEECPIHQNYKEAICKAGDTDTIVTGRIGGTPVRTVIDGDVQNGSLMAGQVAGLCNEIKPLKEIIDGLFEDYKEAYLALEKEV